MHSIPDAGAIDRLLAKPEMNATIPLDTIAHRFYIVLRGWRSTLIATREERGGTAVYRFDIKLQGEDETVFFDI